VLNVTGTSTLATTTVTQLTASGNTSVGGTLNVTGTSTLATTSVTQLNVSGNFALATMTQGSVLFAGVAGVLSQNNSNFYWDNANKYFNIGTNTVASTLAIQGSGSTNPFSIASSTGSTLLTVTSTGNVGIGTSNPAQKLELLGNAQITPSGTNGILIDANGSNARLFSNGSIDIPLVPEGVIWAFPRSSSF
jgi:hypothetical protein